MANDFSELLKAQKETNKQLQHLRKEVAKDEPFTQSDEAKGVAAHMVAKKASGETDVDNLVEKLNKDQQERNQALINSIKNAIGGVGVGTGNPNISNASPPSQQKEKDKEQKSIFKELIASFEKLAAGLGSVAKAPFQGAMSGVMGIFTFLSALFKALAATGVLLGLRELLLKIDGEKFAKIVLDIFDFMEEKFNQIKNYFKEVMDTYEKEGFVAAARKIFGDIICGIMDLSSNIGKFLSEKFEEFMASDFVQGIKKSIEPYITSIMCSLMDIFEPIGNIIDEYRQGGLDAALQQFKEEFPEFSKSLQKLIDDIKLVLGIGALATGVGAITILSGVALIYKSVKSVATFLRDAALRIMGMKPPDLDDPDKPQQRGLGGGAMGSRGKTFTFKGQTYNIDQEGKLRIPKGVIGVGGEKLGGRFAPTEANRAFAKFGDTRGLSQLFGKYPTLGKFLSVLGRSAGPITALIGTAQAMNVLMGDDPMEKKVELLGGILGGQIGAIGGGLLGSAIGGLALGSFSGGALAPVGLLGGGVIGSLAGFFGGDVVGKKLAQFLLGQNPSIFSEGEISRSMDIQRQEEKIANLQRVAGGDVGPYGDIGMSERAKSQLPDEIAKLEQMRQAQARRDYGIGFGHEFEVQEMQQRDRELEPKRNDSMSDLASILNVGNVSNDNSSNVNNYNMNLQHITFPDMQFQVAANQTGPT